jgi:hypothetical protein
MEIKVADVAELVDARDLKFVAPFEIHRIFCITRPETKTNIDAKRRDLHNARIAALGQKRKWCCLNGKSVLPPIVLQNSFWITEDKFSGL